MALTQTTQNQARQPDSITSKLAGLLAEHADKRVVVIGTTCTGKSTMLAAIAAARDMDEIVFPTLTPEEKAYVCQTPWTPEIGRTMSRLVRERVVVEVGKPVFGTVVIDCDLVLLLRISDELLAARTALRGAEFTDAKNMQNRIHEELLNSGLPWIEFAVG